MKIELTQEEINVALTEYIANQGIKISNKTVEVDVTAGRGANGHTAAISIVGYSEQITEDLEQEDTNEMEVLTEIPFGEESQDSEDSESTDKVDEESTIFGSN